MPKAHDSDVALVDGSLDFSGGVNSIKVPTIATAQNPKGLARNQLSWLDNATVRDGGITQRAGWNRLGRVHSGSAFYQGGMVYEPDGANPYLLFSVGGHIFIAPPDDLANVQDLSVKFGLFNPPTERAYFVQAEQFAIIQAGDYNTAAVPTLPLFWDGNLLRRSIGITTAAPPPIPGPNVNQIPAATVMDYYQNRVWYAQNRTYAGGDIVGSHNSGSAGYNYRDSVLSVTENPLAFGGDGFTVPTQAGTIRALKHSANLDTNLGQSNLYIFTRKATYSLNVPVTRTAWIAASANNQPQQTVVQLVNGSVNDSSVVAVNGDLYYQSLEPGIRSLVTAIRYFGRPGNTRIDSNMHRLLQFNDRSLLFAASGMEFDNRLWQTALPVRTPQGIVHKAVGVLDFSPLSTFESQDPPVWGGMYEGLNILQLFTMDFGGLQRSFALVVNDVDSGIDLWELSQADRFDTSDHRVTWYIEFPAFNWGDNFEMKQLASAELWVDRLYGEVVFTMDYRVDGDPCWYPWHKWKQCSARNCAEDVNNPICYPVNVRAESFSPGVTLPKPPSICDKITNTPTDIGFQFQPRLTIHGFCRVRGLYLHAYPRPTAMYRRKIC